MRRHGKRVFANFKQRGEWVELLFMTVAAGLGFTVAKPFGDSARYDVIVEHLGRFLRIQVKSTELWTGSSYVCRLRFAFGFVVYLSGADAGGVEQRGAFAASQGT